MTAEEVEVTGAVTERLFGALLGAIELPVVSAVRVFHAAAGLAAQVTKTSPRGGLLRGHGRDIGIGIAIAIPVLGVFTALLAAADAHVDVEAAGQLLGGHQPEALLEPPEARCGHEVRGARRDR